MLYIVGLGNPGVSYKKTRHNVGASVLETIREVFAFPDFVQKKNIEALISTGSILDKDVTLIFPQTFMNLSGVSVAKICKYMRPDDMLVVIYDDLDIPVGKMKLSFEKNAGGHNGLASIIEHLGSKAFLRMRIGIAQVDNTGKAIRSGVSVDQKDYVLTTFRQEEKEKINLLIPKIQETIVSLLTRGKEKTMSQYKN